MIDKKYLISLDPGHGYVKIAWFDDDGNMQTDKFSSAVAESPSKHLGEDSGILPLFKGSHWIIGEGTNRSKSSDIKDMSKFSGLFDNKELLLYKALDIAGKLEYAAEGKMNVVFELSLAHGKENIDAFANGLKEFTINNRLWKMNSVLHFPQGVAAIKAIKVDSIDGKLGPDLEELFLRKNIDRESFILFDIGVNTLDVIHLQQNVPQPFTHEGFGVISLADRVRSWLRDSMGIDSIQTSEVIEIINLGYYSHRGDKTDMKKVIEVLTKSYYEFLINGIESLYGEYIDKATGMFFVGGGAYLFKDIEPYSSHTHYVTNAEYYNVVGGLHKLEEHLEKEI